MPGLQFTPPRPASPRYNEPPLGANTLSPVELLGIDLPSGWRMRRQRRGTVAFSGGATRRTQRRTQRRAR